MDCGKCKKAEFCNFVNQEWFSPGSIVYCRPQCLFYLKFCDSIRQGEWPQEPEGSNYTDSAIRSGFVKIPAHHAEMFAAEMDSRIKMAGIEGKLLEYEVKLEYPLSSTSYKALNYISGWRRKTQAYSAWKKQNNYRANKLAIKTTKYPHS